MASAIDFVFGANTSALKAGADVARGEINRLKSDVKGMLAGMFAGAGIEALISDFARVQDLADQFGTDAESIQRIRGAAEQAGTGIEFLAKNMAKATLAARKISEDGGQSIEDMAANGNNAAKAFLALGISAEEFAAMQMDEQMLAIAEGMDKLPDEQARIAAGYDLFGAKGKEIIPLLIQGQQALQGEFNKTAVASNSTVAALAEADDKLTQGANAIKVAFASAFEWVSDRIGDVMLILWTLANTAKAVGSAVAAGFGALKSGDFSGVGDAFSEALEKGMDEAADTRGQQLWDMEKSREKRSERRKTSGPKVMDPEDGESSGKKGKEDLSTRLAEAETDAARKRLALEEQVTALKKEQADLTAQAEKESDPEKKAKIEDKVVAAAKERLQLEKQIADQAEKAAEQAAKEQEKADMKAFKDQEKAQESFAKDFADLLEKAGESVSKGLSVDSVRAIGGSLSGVNYNAVNSEAGKVLAVNQAMEKHLASLVAKSWTLKVPEAE